MKRREQGAGRLAAAMTVTILAAVCLSGCGDRAKRRSPEPSASSSGRAQAPVNADPGVTRYLCADGQAVTAGYPDAQTAVVTYKDHAYTLKRGRSADGARYTGYGLQWWTQGGQASLSELKAGEETASSTGLTCTPESPPPNAGPVLRTAYVLDR